MAGDSNSWWTVQGGDLFSDIWGLGICVFHGKEVVVSLACHLFATDVEKLFVTLVD